MPRKIIDRAALVEQALQLRKDGLTYPQVARRLAVSPSSVLRWVFFYVVEITLDKSASLD